jgi:hypothetical protein
VVPDVTVFKVVFRFDDPKFDPERVAHVSDVLSCKVAEKRKVVAHGKYSKMVFFLRQIGYITAVLAAADPYNTVGLLPPACAYDLQKGLLSRRWRFAVLPAIVAQAFFVKRDARVSGRHQTLFASFHRVSSASPFSIQRVSIL